MNQAQYNQLFSFIWNIATDVLVYAFEKGEYKKIIMPMMVLRRIDVLLEPTKQTLLTQKKMLDDTMENAAVQECIAMLHRMEGRIQDGFSHYKHSLSIWEQEYADKPEMIDAKKAEIQKNCEQMGYYLGARLKGII